VQLEGDRALDAAHVILTTPAYASARLLRPLSPALAEGLDAIPYAPIAAVHLGFAPGDAPPLSGFGFLVPHREGRAILGTIYSSSSFPFRAPRGATLLTTLLGGARRPELVELPEEALIVHVQRELGQMLDLRTEPALARATRWTRGIPQYDVGHLERASRLHAGAAALGPLSLSGNAFDGVGIADCVRNAGRLASTLA
jgi:oxygen-dependent protoporphyrinogen oxidase